MNKMPPKEARVRFRQSEAFVPLADHHVVPPGVCPGLSRIVQFWIAPSLFQILRPVHTRELAPATRSCSTLPEQSSLVCTNDFLRKNMLRYKSFALEFCSLTSNWFDMRREQVPGANLLYASVSGASSLMCTEICLPWNDVSLVGQSNWLIFFIHNQGCQ